MEQESGIGGDKRGPHSILGAEYTNTYRTAQMRRGSGTGGGGNVYGRTFALMKLSSISRSPLKQKTQSRASIELSICECTKLRAPQSYTKGTSKELFNYYLIIVLFYSLAYAELPFFRLSRRRPCCALPISSTPCPGSP